MRVEREQLLKDICGLFENSAFIFFLTYKGMSVADFSSLRNQLAESNSECHVVKNSYIKVSVKELNLASLDDSLLVGDTAVVTGVGDCCAIAKLLKEFSKNNDKLTFKGGLLNGKTLTKEEVSTLADLPSLDILRAMLLGTLLAPKQKLVGLLNNKVSTIVYALQAYLNKKEQAS